MLKGCLMDVFSEQYKRLKENQALVKKVVSWLKKKGNSEVKLASELGYSTSTAIYQWVKRGRIPQKQIANVERVLNGG